MPYVPIPMRKGNKVVKRYIEKYIEPNRSAILTKVDYIDRKKKLNIGYILYIKWD